MPEDEKKEEGGQEKDPKNNSAEDKQQEKSNPDDKVEEKKQEGDEGKSETVPMSKFTKNYARMKDAEDKVAEFERKEADLKEAQLKEDNKYDEILAIKNVEIAELSKRAAKADENDSALQAFYESALAEIPEERRGMIPDYSTAKKLEYMSVNKAFLVGTPSNSNPPKTGGDIPKNEGGDNLDDAELIKNQLKDLRDKKMNNGFLTHQEQKQVSSLLIERSKLAKEQA